VSGADATQAVILAGGQGTRLRPLTLARAKPVVPLLNRPFLAYQLALLRDHGVTDVILACSYRVDDVREALGHAEHLGVHLRYVIETEPLGTGGGVRNAVDLMRGTVFVLNGDVLTDADLTLHDLDSKRTVHLSQLSLKTGRLAPVVRTPLQFETLFDVSAPQATGQVRVASTLDLDLGKTNLAASGLDATVKAMLDKQPMEIVVLADRAAYTGASGGIEAIKVDAKAKGKWNNLTLDESRLLVPALVFDPKNKELLWRGQGVAAVSDNQDQYVQELQATVAAILAKFPAAAAKVAQAQ